MSEQQELDKHNVSDEEMASLVFCNSSCFADHACKDPTRNHEGEAATTTD